MTRIRKKFFVDSTVQGALLRRILVHWLAFFTLSVISLIAVEYFLGDPALSFEERFGSVLSKYAFFIFLMLAIIPTFIYDTMLLSHRFAGPILRLKDSLKSLAEDTPVRELKFRENDFWIELSEDFNRVANKLQTSKPSE